MASWLFAQVFPFLSRHEPKPIGAARRDLLQGLSGEVLEIGAGSGVNFALYPSDVTLTATDYSRHMMKKLAAPAREAGIDVVLRQADVRQLPFEDDSFDHTVVTEVFCSVPAQQKGFAEMLRVTPTRGQRPLSRTRGGGGRQGAPDAGLGYAGLAAPRRWMSPQPRDGRRHRGVVAGGGSGEDDSRVDRHCSRCA